MPPTDVINKGDMCDFQMTELRDGENISESIHIGIVVANMEGDIIKGIFLYREGRKVPRDDCFAINIKERPRKMTLMNENGVSEMRTFEVVGADTSVPAAPVFFKEVVAKVGNQALLILTKVTTKKDITI